MSRRITDMMRRRLVAPVLLLACLVAPAVAQASYTDLLKDACRSDEHVDGTYSQADYKAALAHIPTDAEQYTNCREVLRAAQLAAASAQASAHKSTASTVNAATLVALTAPDPLATATPTETLAVERASTQGSAPVKVAGKIVQPGTLGAGRAVAAGLSDLPAPLLAALSLIVLLGFGAALFALVPRARRQRTP